MAGAGFTAKLTTLTLKYWKNIDPLGGGGKLCRDWCRATASYRRFGFCSSRGTMCVNCYHSNKLCRRVQEERVASNHTDLGRTSQRKTLTCQPHFRDVNDATRISVEGKKQRPSTLTPSRSSSPAESRHSWQAPPASQSLFGTLLPQRPPQ